MWHGSQSTLRAFSLFDRTPKGVKCGDLTMTYHSMYNDVMTATKWVHRAKVR